MLVELNADLLLLLADALSLTLWSSWALGQLTSGYFMSCLLSLTLLWIIPIIPLKVRFSGMTSPPKNPSTDGTYLVKSSNLSCY